MLFRFGVNCDKIMNKIKIKKVNIEVYANVHRKVLSQVSSQIDGDQIWPKLNEMANKVYDNVYNKIFLIQWDKINKNQ